MVRGAFKGEVMQRFRPSKAHLWSKCYAFTSFTSGLPEALESDEAREGTCAAWLASLVLTGQIEKARDAIGHAHSNGFVVNAEMADHVEDYVAVMRKTGGEITSEEFVRASENPLIEGTLDTSSSKIVDQILYVNDFKYGRRVVEAKDNPQLICYGWGKLLTMPPGSIRLVHLSIYQPRAVHHRGIYRKWVVSVEELHAAFLKLWNAAVASSQPYPTATPGPHCVDCLAAASCEALAHTTYLLAQTLMSPRRRDLTAKELASELAFVTAAEKIVSARIKAVKAEASAVAKNTSLPGYTIESRYGNRSFSVDGNIVAALTGVDPWERKLCTPAELERRGADVETVKSITSKPVIGEKLVPLTDDDIAEIFTTGKGSQ